MVKDNDILQAVRERNIDNLSKLLQKTKNGKKLLASSKKLNINYQDEEGMAAIHQAALQGNAACINLLINNGAQADIKDNKGMRPLHYAAWQGLMEPVTLLLQAGASPVEPSNNGETPIHFACQHGHVEVVLLLLKYKADPTVESHAYKTSLDLACEFGKYHVVDLLVKSNLCAGLLLDRSDLSADTKRSTPLHLAARGGFTDILQLLMETNIDMTRQTHQGTALHEAALCGKINAVKFLINAGIDVNIPNSYEQTALDIVHKFTRKAGAKELKAVLEEASRAITVKAVKSYSNVNDPQSLTFAAGDLITVIDQKPNGVWRGFVMKDGRKSSDGYFPSNCVAVPDLLSKTSSATEGDLASSGAIFREPPVAPRPWYSSAILANGDLVSPTLRLAAPLTPDSCNSTNGSYHFPPPSPSYRAPEMAVIPENRISTCSRSSSNSGDHRQPYPQTQSYPQTQPMAINVNVNVGTYPQRLSSHSLSEPSRQSYDSRQSYHSNSSSSIGSLDILDETGFSSNVNVAELYRRGMSDADIIYTWLSDLRFDIYFENFLQAGYDMPTISRMTPEDLTAIGITKPIHRKKLKREISKLNIGDGIPDFMPSSVLEWLQCLGLDIYYETLQSQQYDTIDSIIKISWEDLEDIGINLLGHQKKILLAVNRLKKFNKRQSQTSSRDSTPVTGTMPRWSADMAANSGYAINGQVPYRSHSGENVSSQVRECSPYSMAASNSLKEIMNHRSRSRHVSGGEVVPIMTKSGMSRSSSGNSVNSSTDFGLQRCQSFGQAERDSTPPSSEDSGSSYGGSMQRKSSNKGPMKGIHGLTMSKHSSQDSIDQQFRNSMDNQVAQYATLRRTNSRKQSSQSIELQQFGVLPPSPISKTGSSTSPGLGSLPSPFANFRSPYAQIQSGEIKNQLSKGENRSSSVPSSPVTKGATLSNDVNIKAKKPPAPPKRTMSIKRNSDEQVNCEVNEDEETPEFPPPPPPIAFNLQAMKTNQPKNGTRTNEHVAERRTSPFREGLKLQNVIESSLAARRRASSAEKEARNCNSNNNNEMDITPTNQCNSRITDRSNSATPRNSIENIPFANDNAGTIKQKFGQPPLTTGGNADCIEDNLDDALESEDNEDGEFDFDTVKRMPKPVMHVQPVYNEQNHIKLVSEQPKNVMGNDKIQRDVLNDIGCMLENLSSELDAMLDTETGSNN